MKNNCITQSLDIYRDPILCAVESICKVYRDNGKLLVCGNGGSASDSQHIVAELMKGFKSPRIISDEDAAKLEDSTLASKLQRAVPAISLTSEAPLITAIANDIDPEMIFAQQVYAYGKPGDALIGLSTSGKAKNVLNALKVARAFGLITIGFTGSGESVMPGLCDILIAVPETETYRIQEMHVSIYHAICLMVESELFSS
jgi:phosphoheptose isomerase